MSQNQRNTKKEYKPAVKWADSNKKSYQKDEKRSVRDRDFKKDGSSFKKSESRFGKDDSRFKKSDRNFGKDDRNFKKGDRDFRRDDRDFKKGDRDFRRDDRDFKKGDRDFRRDDREFKKDDRDFKKSDRGFKKDTSNMCPYSKKCGGCRYQGMPYEMQLGKKEHQVFRMFQDYCKVYPIVGMKDPYHYRNKVHAVYDRKKDGTIISGIYEERSHRVVDVEACQIENEKADKIMYDIRSLLKSFKIRIYNEDSGFGLFRHVLVRTGHATGQIMVVLVLASPILPAKNNFVKALRKLHPEISTIVLNVNDKNTSMVLGERDIVLYGKGYIEDELCGCTFRISPQSFYQVNPVQTELLYNKAMEQAGLTGKETVIDAYCGTGTIGIIASKHAKNVIGVELNKDAVKDAVINAKRNDVKNIRFYNQDAGKFLVEMAAKGEKADVVIMDPPRSGSDHAFLSSVVKMRPKKIVYVSCNPETLERDIKYLNKMGYLPKGVWSYDLFPYTEHVECICVLTRVQR